MQPDHLNIDRAAINRENSLKSTGPKTEAGKQKSSLNALRHGLTGHVVVLPDEDLDAYQRFAGSFHDDLKPVGALETQLVQSLADDAWRLNRAKALETNLLTLGMHDLSGSILDESEEACNALATAAALRDQTKALSTLSMHQNRIARTFERTLNQLRQIQAERRVKERDDIQMAACLYRLHSIEEPSTPYDASVDGFVFSNAQIEAHIHRDERVHAAFRAA
jgi:hypothetical protein